MTAPKVSIVITTWNRKGETEKTLRELGHQGYPNLEIIVVDNHSTDGTVEMIRQEFPYVRLINMPTPTYGPCESMNVGFANATGEYVVVLDDDSHPEPGVIAKTIEEFDQDPSIGAVAFKITTSAPQPGTSRYSDFRGDDPLEDVPVWRGCGSGIRREVLEKINYYSKVFFTYENEVDAGIKLHLEGYRIKYQPSLVVHHRLSQVNRGNWRMVYFGLKNDLLLIWKYLPLGLKIHLTISKLLTVGFSAIRWRCFGHYWRAIWDACRQRKEFYAEYKIRADVDRRQIVKWMIPFVRANTLRATITKLFAEMP